MAILMLVWGIGSPFTGAVADKLGTGVVIVFGSMCTAIGFVLFVWATSEIHLYVAGVFMGLGVAGAGVSAMVGAIGRRAAPEERTQALSKLGIGSGIGMFIAFPYTHLLIEQLGWQASLYVLALTALSMMSLALVFRGDAAVANATSRPQSLKEALREALVHPSFLLLTSGFFVCGFQIAFYSLHLPAYVADQGIASQYGVWALTMVGIGNLIGTWLAGHSAKYFPKRYSLAFIYLGRGVVFLVFLFVPMNGPLIVVLSFVLGLLWLSTVPLTSSLVATFFGPVWMSMLFGIVFLSHQIGSFTGVWLAGYLYDTTRSYDLMWWISIALGIFAAVVHWPIREQPVARLQTKAAMPVPAE